METLVFKMTDDNIDFEAIACCADIIKHGGIVVFPTETVYGIGASAYDEKAVVRLYELKKRPLSKPLLCHLSSKEQANEIGILNDTANMLISKFTPGPLTLIVKKRPIVPDIVTSNTDTVGLRFPKNRIAVEFINACGMPLAATSANFSGMTSAKNGVDALNEFDGIADAVICSGVCEYSIESTIVSLIDQPKILRQGAISRMDVEEVLGKCL